ncbi:hypothetical protein OOU_Y34scaffold00496g22 [Pyricularia oryzae Y34]|uniref:Secreted protein n=2 Tax=Pyricularia oryzae TaxID=318829 RepID=A0AA97NZZ8_PYRO3|nr:hypothetical protein OOU_Y34scaffold00496g22 [Pyricularia oryzae Y34]
MDSHAVSAGGWLACACWLVTFSDPLPRWPALPAFRVRYCTSVHSKQSGHTLLLHVTDSVTPRRSTSDLNTTIVKPGDRTRS